MSDLLQDILESCYMITWCREQDRTRNVDFDLAGILGEMDWLRNLHCLLADHGLFKLRFKELNDGSPHTDSCTCSQCRRPPQKAFENALNQILENSPLYHGKEPEEWKKQN